MGGWVGVDLDGTLAVDIVGDKYDPTKIGPPVLSMVQIVQEHLRNGEEVRIFTARVSTKDHHTVFNGTAGEYREFVTAHIKAWCLEHIGQELSVTCEKDYQMKLLYDDRARQVVRNEGTIVQCWQKMMEMPSPLPAPRLHPHRCPLCHGTGQKPQFCPGKTMPETTTVCNGCGGAGIVWG